MGQVVSATVPQYKEKEDTFQNKLQKNKGQPYPLTKDKVLCSVADPHRKNADADLGKNLNSDADSCPY
jgi:cellulose synthase/poly-beta-1,6-N-acetylglucosamine synthase-like glycosyltransferase